MASAIPPHVTLLPPTVVEDDALPAFLEHLAKVVAAAEPFDMVLSGTGSFRPVSPVVFVQVSHGIPVCEALEPAVRSGPVERTSTSRTTRTSRWPTTSTRPPSTPRSSGCPTSAAPSGWPVELYHHDDDGVWRVRRPLPARLRAG